MRLYADYLNREYGAVDSDYVFVNLWATPAGRPMTYPAAYDLVTRLRAATGIAFSPHWCRHTYATSCDVPQEVVRVLLDHSSTQMTAHYAKPTDQTVRRRWEQATRVNISGERVTIDPDGPLGQAQWAKTRYGIATQTLPNSYCGLPVQRQCPHANSCLTCPVFITGPEFLPELREQRQRTLTLITTARNNGHVRVTEMNEQVAANLDRMITELEAIGPDEQEDAADAG
jgi:ferredoxin